MHRAMLVAGLVGCLQAASLFAQEPAAGKSTSVRDPVVRLPASVAAAPCLPASPDSACPEKATDEPPPLDIVWGLIGLRIFAAGPKEAPNGQEYHPSFSLDTELNFWIWPSQGLYLFGDLRFWGERPEYGVTNARDGGLGFSKRQFDLSGGVAWNYAGPWEARVYGYSMNNLNRGLNLITPTGEIDGSVLENRYYLSPEYQRLGRDGFDVTRATFLSVAYYPTKDLIGNDGQVFKPGPVLRAYLIKDILDWPVYAFSDTTFIGERSFKPKLLLFDLGVAARPLRAYQHWELRLGAENTADFETHSVLNLWYVALRVIF